MCPPDNVGYAAGYSALLAELRTIVGLDESESEERRAVILYNMTKTWYRGPPFHPEAEFDPSSVVFRVSRGLESYRAKLAEAEAGRLKEAEKQRKKDERRVRTLSKR